MRFAARLVARRGRVFDTRAVARLAGGIVAAESRAIYVLIPPGRLPDGGRQATIGGWPLYRFIGDNGPAKWKGQAVNNSWWVVQSTGQRNVSCLPPGAVAPQG